MAWWQDQPEPVEYEESKYDYTKGQLGQMADDFLRDDAKVELCRTCGETGIKDGEVAKVEQDATDEGDNKLILAFDKWVCPEGHEWYEGEGKIKGIGGDNPILFEEHIQSRRRREIYTKAGTPDPNIVSGQYNRTHPQGRKVNSPEQRKKNGASWYR